MDEELPHILVVDDDDRLRELLRRFLSENGFRVSTARDAADAETRLGCLTFDLIVLDLMMPGESGLDFAARLRGEKGDPVPILMLTAMAEADDRIAGLETGADDYLTKPFEPRELLLRIRNVLRRTPRAEPGQEVAMGRTVYDLHNGRLRRDGTPVRLTSLEAALLSALARSPGTVLSREELSQCTGGEGGGRAIDVQVTRLRRKIEPDPPVPALPSDGARPGLRAAARLSMPASHLIKRFLPRSLLGRSLLIVVTPLVILQLVSGIIFWETHWDNVSLRLSRSVAGDISAVIELMDRFPGPENRIGSSTWRPGAWAFRPGSGKRPCCRPMLRSTAATRRPCWAMPWTTRSARPT